MRGRIAILIALSVLLGATAVLAIWAAGALSIEAQHVFGDGTNNVQPTVAQQDRANELWVRSGALQQVVTPVATAALLCVTAVLSVLAWDWQLRTGRPQR